MKQNQSREILNRVLQHKFAFLFTFFIVMLISYAFLYIIDFIPEPIEEEQEVIDTQLVEEVPEENKNVPVVEEVEPVAALPVKIVFDNLEKREVTVLNPESRNIADLDAALLNGVVRHPDSADFTKDGNIFILGHSSYLPNVFNKNFQAFNGIQDLTWGDTIRLYSDDTEYIYRVDRVYEAKASDVLVPYTQGEAKLTLATCNSFGSKDDRFIVEASRIAEKRLQ